MAGPSSANWQLQKKAAGFWYAQPRSGAECVHGMGGREMREDKKRCVWLKEERKTARGRNGSSSKIRPQMHASSAVADALFKFREKEKTGLTQSKRNSTDRKRDRDRKRNEIPFPEAISFALNVIIVDGERWKWTLGDYDGVEDEPESHRDDALP